jgi:hypothetical protein
VYRLIDIFGSAPATEPLGGLFGGAPAPAFGGQATAPAIGAPAAPIFTKQKQRKKKSKQSKAAQRKRQRVNKKAGPALVLNNDVELPAQVQGESALPETTIESANVENGEIVTNDKDEDKASTQEEVASGTNSHSSLFDDESKLQEVEQISSIIVPTLPVESFTVELYDVVDQLLIMADKDTVTVKDIVQSVAIHFDLLKVEESMKKQIETRLTDLIQGYVNAPSTVS